MRINESIGHLQDWITQVWVKVTGRRFDPMRDTWLPGPAGDTDLIGEKFIQTLALREQLAMRRDTAGAGLLPGMDDLQLSPEDMHRLDPRVADFYTHTSQYRFEFWSTWCGIFRPFGWVLAVLFSRRLQQLNLPLSAMDASQGLDSQIIQLMEPQGGQPRWTVWFRTLKSTQRVIYAGVYTTCALPGKPGRALKVVFPLPNGNATVIMRCEVLANGALKLSSDGRRFGDYGFYFTLTNHRGKHWARFVRAMHEWITVYVDGEGVLRADHELFFRGMPFLRLHYKMEKKGGPASLY